MSAKKSLDSFRTWIELDARAAAKNYIAFRKLAGKKTALWAVVKSNAYGHGLYAFSKLMAGYGVDGFCVDSVVEGSALRRAGINKPILVLGQTLPARYAEAAKNRITISISNFEALSALSRAKQIPDFHLKLDTGMHRQGFYPEAVPKVIKSLIVHGPRLMPHLKGLFTHFASAKDLARRAHTDGQLKKFKKAADSFEEAGFRHLILHASATGGTLLGRQYHLDAVRVGIGLYGLWPSEELEAQLGKKIKLNPVLSWRVMVSEVKDLKAGDRIGYDLTERVSRATAMAVLPIGYWHGFPRALSSIGQVLIRGTRAKVLGRVSMDMIVVAAPKGTKPGDVATIIGRGGGGKENLAKQVAAKSGTIHYELLTRLNPLMERVIIR